MLMGDSMSTKQGTQVHRGRTGQCKASHDGLVVFAEQLVNDQVLLSSCM